MLDMLYTLLIQPIEFWMNKALMWGFDKTQSWGWAIIVMSLVVNVVILPIYLKAETWQEEERRIRKSIENDEKMIKETFKGQERFAMISTLYRQAGFSPLMSLRSSVGFFLQIPFFFAAYHFLSQFKPFQGVSFLGLTDLSKPDAMFSLLGININIMPILMTVINLVSALIYTQNLSRKDKFQLYGMAGLFFVLLYNATSSLVLYWTCNNIFSLGKNIVLESDHFKFISNKFSKRKSAFFAFTSNLNPLVLLPPLCLLCPVLMLWPKNFHQFTSLMVVSSIAVLLIFSVLLVFISYLFFKTTFSQTQYGVIFYLTLNAAIFCCLATTSIRGTFYEFRYIVPVAILALFIFSYYLINAKHMVMVLSFLCLVFTVQTFYSHIDANKAISSKETSRAVAFENKPNIYYFLCESYNNFNLIKNVYGLDESRFISDLENLGFTNYNNVFSNQSNTLGTLLTVYTMSLQDYSFGNQDVVGPGREIIAGGEGNNLFRLLKENDYEIHQYTKGSKYFYTKKGKYLDKADLQNSVTISDFLEPLLITNRTLGKIGHYEIIEGNISIERDNISIVKNFLNHLHENDKPKFFALQVGADHTPSNGTYNYTKEKEWIASNQYQRLVQKGNSEIKTIVLEILDKDPNAVIVLMGDHGSWRLREIEGQAKNLSEVKEHLIRNLYSFEDFVKDRHYIFAAIKMPKGYAPVQETFSPVNVFPKIFKILSPNSAAVGSLVEAPNYSKWKDFVIVKDGAIQN